MTMAREGKRGGGDGYNDDHECTKHTGHFEHNQQMSENSSKSSWEGVRLNKRTLTRSFSDNDPKSYRYNLIWCLIITIAITITIATAVVVVVDDVTIARELQVHRQRPFIDVA